MVQPLGEQQRQAWREILRQAAVRAKGENDLEAARQQRQQWTEQEYAEVKEQIEQTFAQARRQADEEIAAARQQIPTRFEEEQHHLKEDFSRAKDKTNRNHAANRATVEGEYKETRWTILTLYEADKKVSRDQVTQAQTKLRKTTETLKAQQHSAIKLIKGWKLADELVLDVDELRPASADPWLALELCVSTVADDLGRLQAMRLPRYLRGAWPILATAVFWAVVSLPALFLADWYIWLGTGTLAAAVLAWPVWHFLRGKVRRLAHHWWVRLRQAVLGARTLRRQCLDQARQTYKKQRAHSKTKHQKALDRALDAARKEFKAAKLIHEQAIFWAEERYRKTLEKLSQQRDLDVRQAEERYQQRLTEVEARRDHEMQAATARYHKLCEESQRRHDQDWAHLALGWRQACDQFQAMVRDADEQCQAWFPSWNKPFWKDWPPPKDIPLALRFGRLQVTPERIPHALPSSPLLPALDLQGHAFPALLGFPQRSSLLLEVAEQGRDQAVAALQALLLRAWTSLPPGKVRCTILDPVGRGENFASFMHLADYDELLVTGRIWTEVAHIDQRLEDLTAHMENVLQKYLRNQYKSLAEYNAQAGEMAEPFRFLVVANFPVNFSPDACRRLISLASSGARCGIYTLVMVDTRVPLPMGIEMEDLEQACVTLRWHKDHFAWQDPDFGKLPLDLESPPAADVMARLLNTAGKRAKEAGKVEVPFDVVAPPADRWWTADSRLGISVPLGRVGATGQQLLSLGQGTSQHVLVAGKTGSGKSTLMHALITQLALRYSPREIELYLIDFKKGVEFKTYAAHELPHARVVAVESEREFGLSVLQRLDAELVRRGEIFRERGANDLPSFRQSSASQASNGEPAGASMPRILLLVDEFQEFFVEDDKTAQEAALLMDRLVRQGRAFGIHIILGSQTLGGAYSLARSTLDQMAVRIALQCSEADAHLILSKENGDARLLTRPGEAIYNASGGQLEGNNLFQIVWLSEGKRDDYLRRLLALAQQRDYRPPHPQIVFEGTAPAALEKNALLSKILDEPPAMLATGSAWHAWLGDAVAIKDPTAAVFRRHSGCNLLLVGQNAEAAFNMMTSAMVSLQGQIGNPSHADGGRIGNPSHVDVGRIANPSYEAGPTQTQGNGDGSPPFQMVVATPLEGETEQLSNLLPELLPLRMVSQRDLPDALNKLADEVNRRQKEAGAAEPLFLLLHGLQRIRDLRRPEDDFGFGRKGDDKPNPYRQFIHVAREGPPLGVFLMVWCDSLHNLQRTLDRQTMREFEMRVLFQMSAADSSNLIDSPVASKLGMFRALFYTEDQGRIEKFRPYGLPSADWLRQVSGKASRTLSAG